MLDKIIRTPKSIHIFLLPAEDAPAIKAETVSKLLLRRLKTQSYSPEGKLIDLPKEVREGFSQKGLIWFAENTPPGIRLWITQIKLRPTVDRLGVKFAFQKTSFDKLLKTIYLEEEA